MKLKDKPFYDLVSDDEKRVEYNGWWVLLGFSKSGECIKGSRRFETQAAADKHADLLIYEMESGTTFGISNGVSTIPYKDFSHIIPMPVGAA